MYVAIDRESLQFLYKHPSYYALTQLVWIQNPKGHIDIQPCDEVSFLHLLTDYELKILYENTVAIDSVYYRERLRNVLMEIVHRMPEVDLNLRELQLQADSLPDDNHVPMLYVKGASRPTRLLELVPFTTTPSQEELRFSNLGKNAPVTLYGTTVCAPVPMPSSAFNAAPVPMPPQSTQNAPTRQRSAGVRETICAVADELWEASGSPTDLKVILKLRKEIMDVLEQKYQVKRNSSSNELGNWQRLKFS